MDSERSETDPFVRKVNDSEESETPAFSLPSKKSNKKFLLMGIVVVIVIAAFAFFVLGRKGTPAPSATPEPTSTTAPTPTPNPLVRSEWSFEVLNGSGRTGEAKKIADQLIAAGYSVVKTGNADRDNYESSQILVKKGMEDKIELVIADLKAIVKIASVGGELKDSTASARIILGKE